MSEGFGHRGPGRGGFGRDGRHGGPFGGGGFGGGGRGRRRMFGGEELKLVLLKLIGDTPRHGYDLIREIESMTGGTYAPSPGVVYPMLTMLADMDLVAEQPGEGSRKLFGITETGTAYLAENAEEVEQVLARLKHLADHAQRTDAAPVRRAVENLKAAIRNRLEKEGADTDVVLDVAALIDEAAAKIERMKR